jgi:hypothetical protein
LETLLEFNTPLYESNHPALEFIEARPLSHPAAFSLSLSPRADQAERG